MRSYTEPHLLLRRLFLESSHNEIVIFKDQKRHFGSAILLLFVAFRA